MGWVSATQYEPEFWGKLPVVSSVSDPIGGGFTVVLPDGGETKVVRSEAKVVEPKVEPKAVDTAPAVKRVAKKTTPKTKPKTEQADDKE